MKSSSRIVWRPVCCLVSLMILFFSIAALLIPFWIKRFNRIEHQVELIAHDTNEEVAARIQRASALFAPIINSSALNLGRILSSSLDVDNPTFPIIHSKVAPSLFQHISTTPYLSQISYIGLNGLLFAYFTKSNRLYALYSNYTFSSHNYAWYIQTANQETGNLFGKARKSPPLPLLDSTWFQEALNTSNGHASAETGWGPSRETLFLSTVGLRGKRAAISLGFPMNFVTDFLVREISPYNRSLYLATADGKVLSQDNISVGNIPCPWNNGSFREDSVLRIGAKKCLVHCSPVEIAGLKLVYAIILPQNGLWSLTHSNFRLAFVLLVLMIVFMAIVTCIFMYVITHTAKREMYLCGALINQMEVTRQSERKSMNKSLAFARMSHDIRASLAGITGLIEICRGEITKKDPSWSGMLTNLHQMEACTSDLLVLLNSILDTSKIESGKMELEEEEFDMEQLLEDVVDLFHPLGTKKGIDVILDPHDGSVMNASWVKGDRGKLRQILSNLLSNAVKFTSEGHVIVRAWARKPSLGNASDVNNSMSCGLLRWLFRMEKAYNESEVTGISIKRDPKCVEFLFEVIDTGKGIPKEKQKSVFENYVQANEGQEGTGLGLGIVQSLVRLMGGEIEIVNKEMGEKGTCFKFNVFFIMCEAGNTKSSDIKAINIGYLSSDSFHHAGPATHFLSPKSKAKGSQVLLLIKSAERCKAIKSFMQRLGIKAHVVSPHENLSQALKRIKQNLTPYSDHGLSVNSITERTYLHTSSGRSKEVPLSALDGSNDISPSNETPGPHGRILGFVLVVIDACAGPFREMSLAVAEFRKDLTGDCCSRVVWLNRPGPGGGSTLYGLDEEKLPPWDLVISKPLHGYRLGQVIGLLPEFGGSATGEGGFPHNDEIDTYSVVAETDLMSRKREIVEGKNRLTGKKILVVDDDSIGRKVATFVLSQLGAQVTSRENGEEAWRLVWEKLEEGAKDSSRGECSLPFDCIFMDCEMPVMNGIEGTRRIRKMEESYGVRMAIMGLTAHNKGEEMERMVEAGVDAYITKPLNKDNCLKVIAEVMLRR